MIAALAHSALASRAGAAMPARIAVFDLELVDSSLQGEMAGLDPADQARVRLVQEELQERLQQSGRFELVDTAPVADQVAVAGRLWSCNGCEVSIARRSSAVRTGGSISSPTARAEATRNSSGVVHVGVA